MAKQVRNAAAEAIMFGQSALLMGMGIAGYISADTVLDMAYALQDKDSAAYFITDEAIVTDKTQISTSVAMSIATNFSLVCFVCFVLGALIFTANTIRRFKN